MKLGNFEQVSALRHKLIDIEKKLAIFRGMTEPNEAWADHGGLLRADVRHPTEYRAGSVEIEVPVDFVALALMTGRQIVVGQLRELGVEIEK